ncbi:MAG: putative glycosyltransferase family 1 protein [Streblomastix strix]|uniref:UDP-N-acetylglucosamine transferase subunit ALG13 n=1 Tax=Streblomastix strix TaxID=222440 RepID=A0A5J4WBT4_9EUKA|nr:MAG: putative glycosyltransferase family 1 protein [Streblomastix strix]
MELKIYQILNYWDCRAFFFIKKQTTKILPSLADELQQADLIISHCGAGTILEALHLSKPLIVVVNDTLLHNHQTELANALHESGHLISASCNSLTDALLSIRDKVLIPLPSANPVVFGEYLEQISS